MHVRMAWPVRFAMLAFGVFMALCLTHGQAQQSSPSLNASKATPAPKPPADVPPVEKAARDFAQLAPLQKQIWLSAQRGAEWLHRANGPDGRFAYGVVPALRAAMEGDHFLRQVGAAATLARAAHFSSDQRYAARATQSIVTLLADTVEDASDTRVRYTAFPPASVNRLAAAGLLVLAIHELPDPDNDLLAKAEQLCN